MTQQEPSPERLTRALTAESESTRLQAALYAGTHPGIVDAGLLLERCAVETDFFVRDTLSWALTCYDRETTYDRVLLELHSPVAQARSQALHTLSKLGDKRAWPSVIGFLQDADDQIARTAWRAAAALVSEGQEAGLAETLSTQFGRGDHDLQRSLTRALAALGPAAEPVIERAKTHAEVRVRAHAIATERLLNDPDEQFGAAIAEANRILAVQGAPTLGNLDADR